MEQRYQTLRFIGKVYKILAIIVAVLLVLALLGGALGAVLGGGRMMGRFDGGGRHMGMALLAMAGWGLGALIYGTVVSITLYAMGEGVGLALSVEENTRRAAELLEGRSDATQPSSPTSVKKKS